MHNPFVNKYYCALLDSPSNAVLALGTNLSTMFFVQQGIPDSHVAGGVHFPSYLSFLKSFFLGSISPKKYPTWTWSYTTRTFTRTKKRFFTNALIARSQLAVSKYAVYEKIRSIINYERNSVGTGMQFQEIIYLTKKMQAKAFKDSGYSEGLIMEYPLVIQYADAAHLSLQQAAEDILFKAKLDEDLLAKTELLRLSYLNKLKEANTLEQLTQLHEEFLHDTNQMFQLEIP